MTILVLPELLVDHPLLIVGPYDTGDGPTSPCCGPAGIGDGLAGNLAVIWAGILCSADVVLQLVSTSIRRIFS